MCIDLVESRMLDALDAAQKRRFGAFMTPPCVANLMAEQLGNLLSRRPRSTVLDPAVGTGRLLAAVGRRFGAESSAEKPRLLGVELQTCLAEVAARRAAIYGGLGSGIRTGDALALLDVGTRRELFGQTTVDAIIANPPYVREKSNRAAFEWVRQHPDWAPLLRPRQDLQQLFLLLALELLAPGGEMVFLVNSYWLSNDSGQSVRTAIRRQAALISLVDFGQARLFDDAVGQHNLMLHARKFDRTEAANPRADRCLFVRVRNKPADLKELCDQVVSTLRGTTPKGASLEVSRSQQPRPHGSYGRWHLPSPQQALLDEIEADSVPLGHLFRTHQGVVSGADRVTARNRVLLAAEAPAIGTGVFILSNSELEALSLNRAESALLQPVYRGRHISRYQVDDPSEWVIYLGRGSDLGGMPQLEGHLARFRPILERRREVRDGTIAWWELHWPRDPSLFDGAKIVTPRRAQTPRFAMGRPGCCEQSDLALITAPRQFRSIEPDRALCDKKTRSPDAHNNARAAHTAWLGLDVNLMLRALLVVLNSSLVACWSASRGKHKGHMREFFGRALEEIPLPSAVLTDPERFAALSRFSDGSQDDAADDAVQALYGVRIKSTKLSGTRDCGQPA